MDVYYYNKRLYGVVGISIYNVEWVYIQYRLGRMASCVIVLLNVGRLGDMLWIVVRKLLLWLGY